MKKYIIAMYIKDENLEYEFIKDICVCETFSRAEEVITKISELNSLFSIYREEIINGPRGWWNKDNERIPKRLKEVFEFESWYYKDKSDFRIFEIAAM